MSSLKEIKARIASILSTQKITAAMKMVSSAKLHHAQALTERTVLYADRLSTIVGALLSAECDLDSPYMVIRPVRRVTLVVCSSSAGLCGTYNANVWKALEGKLEAYKRDDVVVELIPVGKKVADELRYAGVPFVADFQTTGEKPSYEGAMALAEHLTQGFIEGKSDKVELLYHHFKNTATQMLTDRVYLPLSLDGIGTGKEDSVDFILEPSAVELRDRLFPKLLNLMIYTMLLDTSTAEHAARMMAMQTANDNANDLLQQLTLQYNKTRQQSITNELLDIMGGASGS